ncbi:histidine-rich glycoprotein-like [Copidosoma floridanum]|uniref:histidine-rich glycoprotein-like n=1 Tax=Copidosoma floridanum TaxID=29053 RepID=UPI0006C98B7F|nr:histidine-rich glycoprotein-like [Copidosoma floridanum]
MIDAYEWSKLPIPTSTNANRFHECGNISCNMQEKVCKIQGTIRHTVTMILLVTLVQKSQSGLVSVGEPHHHHHHEEHKEHHHEEHEDHHHHFDHHHHVANSYMHFHGPVEGPEFEVKIPYIEPHHHHHDHHNEHNELHHRSHEPSYVMDYVAHPKYEFSYGVEDHHTGDFHSQKEIRDGSSVTGVYSIAEPGGRVRVVSYRADKDGFHADVHMTGKNDHSSGTYAHEAGESHHHHHHQLHSEASTHIEQQQHYPHQPEQPQHFQGYPAHEGAAFS